MAWPDDVKEQYGKHARLISDFREIFLESPQGQRILEHLKDRFHYHRTTAAMDLNGQPMTPIDKFTMAVNEGCRTVVLYMIDMARTDLKGLKDEYEKAASLYKGAQDDSELDDLGV